MVFTAMGVQEAKTVVNDLLVQLQPDHSTIAPQATAVDRTWVWTKSMSYNSNIALQVL